MAVPGTLSSGFMRNLGTLPPESVIFGRSQAMQAVRQRVDRIAAANVPVLIEGESGTGKDIIARLIHRLSPWQAGPFVKVNCPAIPATLLESELFGYEKGAFTGAVGSKAGRVEMANRGTLFLDEISEMDASLQSKFLQLLQDGQFCRIGAQDDRKIDARVVCATNRVLQHEIEAGNFRQDLFYRVNVFNIQLPPLRERAVDIPELTSYFLELYNEKYNCRARNLSPQLLLHLQRYEWPGNIRELENLMRRYVIIGTEDAIGNELMPRKQTLPYPEIPIDGSMSLKRITRQMVRELERKIILRVLESNNWNRKRAARALSISYRALLYKVREAGLTNNRIAANETAQTLDAD